MQVLAGGQVAASTAAIYTGDRNRGVSVTLQNTSASATQTATLTLTLNGTSTARRLDRVVLAPNESRVINGVQLGNGDVLKADTTNASVVDYLVLASTGPLSFQTFDANGALKQVNSGQDTGSIGASTIALGTTAADAAPLPAGTAKIYPTTAADDTVGVIINAADKVTGRTLFIGNGVANKILKVYGPTGATINGGSANAAFSSVSGKGVIITCLSGASNTWLAW